jgi:hypothetical protein
MTSAPISLWSFNIGTPYPSRFDRLDDLRIRFLASRKFSRVGYSYFPRPRLRSQTTMSIIVGVSYLLQGCQCLNLNFISVIVGKKGASDERLWKHHVFNL